MRNYDKRLEIVWVTNVPSGTRMIPMTFRGLRNPSNRRLDSHLKFFVGWVVLLSRVDAEEKSGQSSESLTPEMIAQPVAIKSLVEKTSRGESTNGIVFCAKHFRVSRVGKVTRIRVHFSKFLCVSRFSVPPPFHFLVCDSHTFL